MLYTTLLYEFSYYFLMAWKFGSSQFGKIVNNATMNIIVLNIWILMHMYIIFCILTYCLSLTHYNKSPQTGWLQQQASISHSSESWEVQDQGASGSSVLGELTSSFASGHLLAMSSRGREQREEASSLLSLFLQRSLIPLWGFCPHDLIISQRTHLLIPSHLG